MARRLNKNLIALGSAAIVGVYAIGYARTQPGNGQAVAGTPSAPTAAAGLVALPQRTVAGVPPLSSTAPPVSTATAIAQAIATASPAAVAPRATPGSNGTGVAAAGFRDGTYSGYGTSRRGDIGVAVTVKDGRVTGVQITQATTYYPTSRIARLPGEVVARQSAQVDLVSGATLSSRAFRDAVAQALSQANAAAAVAAPAGA